MSKFWGMQRRPGLRTATEAQRYLVWYEGKTGGLFSIDVGSTLKQAEWNRDLFIEDGYPARIVKLTVENGEPVARWVT